MKFSALAGCKTLASTVGFVIKADRADRGLKFILRGSRDEFVPRVLRRSIISVPDGRQSELSPFSPQNKVVASSFVHLRRRKG